MEYPARLGSAAVQWKHGTEHHRECCIAKHCKIFVTILTILQEGFVMQRNAMRLTPEATGTQPVAPLRQHLYTKLTGRSLHYSLQLCLGPKL
uniref:Uncharacterized protein n=1 Tax=Pararge aegeria TaxID=116150 RepID=S4PLX5_9NEOP